MGKSEWRRVLHSAFAEVLILAGLQKRQQAVSLVSLTPEGGDATAMSEEPPTAESPELLETEDVENKIEMSSEVAAQLGSNEALERLELPVPNLPPAIFRTRLHTYQAQAVLWMWRRENPTSKFPAQWLAETGSSGVTAVITTSSEQDSLVNANLNGRQLSPMWDEYDLPGGPDLVGSSLYFNSATGAVSLVFPEAGLSDCRGGILADDMGFGKTVMCLALLALDKAPGLPEPQTAEMCSMDGAAHRRGAGGTLVVLPVSLLQQWVSEVNIHFPASRKPSVYEYHGAGCKISAEHLRSFDIVFTTYGTLGNSKDDAPLLQVWWRRVMLDEAHIIKNRMGKAASATFRLCARCRWAVTGTPMQNTVDELYSLIRFLNVQPWCTWRNWRCAVSDPLRHGCTQTALAAARRILHPLLLRRTKQTTDPRTGEPLLRLPPKHVHLLELDLMPAERDVYDALHLESKRKFDTFVASGQVLSHYTHILQLLVKLRQAICHPFLVFSHTREKCVRGCFHSATAMSAGDGDSVSGSYEVVRHVVDDLVNGAFPNCPICHEAPEDPALAPCGHIFCRECILFVAEKLRGECPVCLQPGVNASSLQLFAELPGELPEEMQGSKIRALLRLLKEDMAAGRRAIVFSQWTSFLDLVSRALEGQTPAVPWRRFDGSHTLLQRRQAVEWLNEAGEPKGRVLLISMKAGGVGLNLVAATRVYMLDLWWNPAVEEQAIQRVHRIGQTEDVHVYKFVVRASIDSNIITLQRSKAHLCEGLLGHNGSLRDNCAAAKLGLDDFKLLFSS